MRSLKDIFRNTSQRTAEGILTREDVAQRTCEDVSQRTFENVFDVDTFTSPYQAGYTFSGYPEKSRDYHGNNVKIARVEKDKIVIEDNSNNKERKVFIWDDEKIVKICEAAGIWNVEVDGVLSIAGGRTFDFHNIVFTATDGIDIANYGTGGMTLCNVSIQYDKRVANKSNANSDLLTIRSDGKGVWKNVKLYYPRIERKDNVFPTLKNCDVTCNQLVFKELPKKILNSEHPVWDLGIMGLRGEIRGISTCIYSVKRGREYYKVDVLADKVVQRAYNWGDLFK